MEQRTVEEIKAYADGYNDCYNQFVKVIGNKNRIKAIHEMHDVFLKAVNDCVYKEQEMPVDENVYLCGGNPKCFGKDGCGLCGKGYCFCTAHIQFARNRYSLLNGKSENNYRLAKWEKAQHIGDYLLEHSK